MCVENFWFDLGAEDAAKEKAAGLPHPVEDRGIPRFEGRHFDSPRDEGESDWRDGYLSVWPYPQPEEEAGG